MADGLSRRALLGSGVALRAATLLTGGQRASASGGPMIGVYGPARVGATFDLVPFEPAISNYAAAVADWNMATGTTMKCWKLYYKESKFPASLPLEPRLTIMIKQGIQALISFKPTPDIHSQQGNADRSKLRDAVLLLKANKLLAEVCLWQEIRPKDMASGQYKDLVEFYAPVIRSHYPLVFDAAGYLGPKEWKAYKPDDSLLDGYALDFYGGDFLNHGITIDQFIPLAGIKPVGLWEIGNTASSHFSPDPAEGKRYLDHIKQSGGNEIVGTHP